MITKLQVKYIQSLGQKKVRDQEAVFIAEGPKIVNELLAMARASLQLLYALPAWIDSHANLLNAVGPGVIMPVQQSELDRISFLQSPNEVLAVFAKPVNGAIDAEQALCLVLDGIQDPGNMGTMIRIADWFGLHHVICSPDCADAFAPKVIQSTMGSILRVQVQYTDLPQLVRSKPDWPLYAAVLEGESIYGMPALTKGGIVIGNESKGISPELVTYCKHRITIPRTGAAESLNAAVAAGIILSHLAGGESSRGQV